MNDTASLAEQEPIDDRRCFACGPQSEHGLRLVFRVDPQGGVVTETVLADDFQGWQGFAHGGIVMMLLDEAMAHACAAVGETGVTAGVRIRFRKPVPLGVPIGIFGRLNWRKGRVLSLNASVRDENGKVLASGEGEFISRGPVNSTLLAERLGLGGGSSSE